MHSKEVGSQVFVVVQSAEVAAPEADLYPSLQVSETVPV